jgi:hypothetical protein
VPVSYSPGCCSPARATPSCSCQELVQIGGAHGSHPGRLPQRWVVQERQLLNSALRREDQGDDSAPDRWAWKVQRTPPRGLRITRGGSREGRTMAGLTAAASAKQRSPERFWSEPR